MIAVEEEDGLACALCRLGFAIQASGFVIHPRGFVIPAPGFVIRPRSFVIPAPGFTIHPTSPFACSNVATRPIQPATFVSDSGTQAIVPPPSPPTSATSLEVSSFLRPVSSFARPCFVIQASSFIIRPPGFIIHPASRVTRAPSLLPATISSSFGTSSD